MKKNAESIDLIIDTVSANHQISTYIPLLGTFGKLVVVGVPTAPINFPLFDMLRGRKAAGASLIGGIKRTQDVLDFCAKHNVLPDCEVQPIAKVNECLERLERGDVRYRFVLDCRELCQLC